MARKDSSRLWLGSIYAIPSWILARTELFALAGVHSLVFQDSTEYLIGRPREGPLAYQAYQTSFLLADPRLPIFPDSSDTTTVICSVCDFCFLEEGPRFVSDSRILKTSFNSIQKQGLNQRWLIFHSNTLSFRCKKDLLP